MTLVAANQTKAGYYDAGKVQTGAMMVFGHNTGRKNYFTGAFPFINVVKTGGNWYNLQQALDQGASVDANGYVDMTGKTGKIAAVTHSDGDYTQTGDWVLTWDTADSTECNWTGGTENNIGAGGWPTVNRKEYTVSSDVAPANVEVNYSGGLCTNIQVFLKSEETRLNAGNIINSTYVSDVAGIQIMRVMPNQATYSTAIQDWVDVTPMSYYSWGKGDPHTDDVPTQANAQMCNEIDCDIWISIPHQATNDCIDSMATELFTYLDAGRTVYVEWSNETWNSIFPQQKYAIYLDAPEHNCTVDYTTATATEAGHGLVTGDQINTNFNNITKDWPYAGGGDRWVIVDDANTFRFANSFDAADVRGNDCLVVADPDWEDFYEPDATVTEVRYFKISDSINTTYVNYANRAIQCFDRFTAVFGADRIKRVIGSFAANDFVTSQTLAAPGMRENYDYVAIAPYAQFDGMPGYETATVAQITDWLIDTYLPNTIAPWFADHIADTGTYNIICYECGDHTAPGTGNIPGSQKALDWALSSESTRFYTYYFKWMASQGLPISVNFDDHRGYVHDDTSNQFGSGNWGVMEHIGETDAAEYLGVKDFIDAGGIVGKL